MIKQITLLLVLVLGITTAQWNRPGQQQNNQWNSQIDEDRNNGRQQWNRPNEENTLQNGQGNRPQEENSQSNWPWGNQQGELNQNRPSNNRPNRPGGNRPNRPNRPTSTVRSTTRRQQSSSTTQSTTSASSGGSTPSGYTTTASPAYTACLSMCRTTTQYNPVCGTDEVTYNNQQRLNCAINCGANVQLSFMGACEPV